MCTKFVCVCVGVCLVLCFRRGFLWSFLLLINWLVHKYEISIKLPSSKCGLSSLTEICSEYLSTCWCSTQQYSFYAKCKFQHLLPEQRWFWIIGLDKNLLVFYSTRTLHTRDNVWMETWPSIILCPYQSAYNCGSSILKSIDILQPMRQMKIDRRVRSIIIKNIAEWNSLF